jgi:hypothetical protein
MLDQVMGSEPFPFDNWISNEQVLKTYVRSTMNNNRLSSLELMHIHRDFSVDLDKAMEKFVSAKTRRTDLGQF